MSALDKSRHRSKRTGSFSQICMAGIYFVKQEPGSRFDTMRYLVSKTDCDIFDTLINKPLIIYTFTYELFQWLLHLIEYPARQRSHQDRAKLMASVARNMRGECIIEARDFKSSVLLALGGMDMETCIRNMDEEECFSLLQYILAVFASHLLRALKMRGKVIDIDVDGMLEITSSNDDSDIKDDDCLEDIHGVIDDIIFACSKVYNFGTTYEGLPFGLLDELISGVICYIREGLADPLHQKNYYGFLEANVRYLFGMWLSKLISAGIDLIKYGQWEKRQYNEAYWCAYTHQGRFYRWGYDGSTCKYWRLLSFTYGPKESEWQFWFTEEVQYICWNELADFWDMVEHPERQMPGAWNFDM